jgi:hypothetical protein
MPPMSRADRQPRVSRAKTLRDIRTSGSAMGKLREGSMRADEAEQASQAVECLNHRCEESGIAAVPGEHLADRQFEAADHLFGFLALLIRHVSSPSVLSGSRRSSSASVSARCTSRGPLSGSTGATRQPRQPQALQRNGARPVTCRRTRSNHDRERERCVDAWHAGHITDTLQTIPDLSPEFSADRGVSDRTTRMAMLARRRRKKGMELIRGTGKMQRAQRYGEPRRRATRARRSASVATAVMSIPLSISPSMSARMISARFSTLPLLPRISMARESRW